MKETTVECKEWDSNLSCMVVESCVTIEIIYVLIDTLMSESSYAIILVVGLAVCESIGVEEELNAHLSEIQI